VTSNVAEGGDLVRAYRIYTRRTEARKLREQAAELAFLRPHPDHISNAEEAEYRRPNGELSYIANYSKGLRHNDLGEVIPRSYRSLLRSLHSGNPDHFEQILLGLLPGKTLQPVVERSHRMLKRTGRHPGVTFWGSARREGRRSQSRGLCRPPRMPVPEGHQPLDVLARGRQQRLSVHLF
jgi:hypothetical protein